MRCIPFLLLLVCSSLADPLEDALEKFIAGNHKFSSDIYREIIKNEKGSFVASPFSAETILALTYEGAKGETAAELAAGLALPSTKQEIQQAFRTLLPKLTKSEEELKLLSANKIYVGEGVELEDDFNVIATRVYRSGVDNVNFSQSAEAARKINYWVEDNTNKKIQDIIKSDKISAATKMILINTLYFSGHWSYMFDALDTKKMNFYKSEKDYDEVDTMSQIIFTKYYESIELDAKFLELPYENSDISMVFVLPNEREGLANLEENIDELFEPQKYTGQRVYVKLPKFKIESEIKFVPILQKLGIKKAFQDGADFSGISSTDKDLYISDVVQKALIDVTETGTLASAGTAVCISLLGEDYPRATKAFYADHPFLYYIRDTNSGAILFLGRYTH